MNNNDTHSEMVPAYWDNLYDTLFRPKILEVYHDCCEELELEIFPSEICKKLNDTMKLLEYTAVLGIATYLDRMDKQIKYTKDINFIMPGWLSFIGATNKEDYPSNTYILSINIVSKDMLEHIFVTVSMEFYKGRSDGMMELVTTLYEVVPEYVQ